MGSLTRVLAERPCLAEQVEGEYVQTEVLVRYEHSLDAGEEVEVTLAPVLQLGDWWWVLGLGLGVKLRGSRDACAALYQQEGAEGVPVPVPVFDPESPSHGRQNWRQTRPPPEHPPMTPMFDSAAQMMRSDEGPWAASQSKSSSDGDTDSGSNGFVGMPRGLFCGEFRLDSYLPVTVDWSVRFAALF